MLRKIFVALALLGSAVLATPTSAIVSYTFNGPIGTFVYLAPTYLGANVSVDSVSLAECTFVYGPCESVGLYPDARGVGFVNDTADAVTYIYDHSNATSFFYFQNNVMQNDGAYKDTFSGLTAYNTLTVRDVHRPTPGTVTYNIHNNSLDVTFTGHAYADGAVYVPASSLTDCVIDNEVCSGVQFFGDPSAAGSPSTLADAVVVSYDHGNGFSYFYFGENTLSVPGVYSDTFFGDTTLTVYAVPEPHSWLMMVAGFGLLGGLARGRRAPSIEATLRGSGAREA